jgi:pyruvate carboxylase
MRITLKTSVKDGLQILRQSRGYFMVNTWRDLSQSDFKNRILPHTDLAVAETRDACGLFSLEITGGASIHVDMLRKQINPFLKLKLLRERMPNTLFQTLCRGINLFGYRPYPENVIRLTVQEFAKHVQVWRVFDFLNHLPNMLPIFEEVQKAGCYLEPAVCFSTGPEHTDAYYVNKVKEIVSVTGKDIILAIKNHGGLGSPARIRKLIRAILDEFPNLIINYHGHNTDGNEIGRIVEAVKAGAKIVDASDHAMTGYFGPPPMLTVIQTLEDEGYVAEGINMEAIIETSSMLKPIRKHYEIFESQFKGFDPTAQIHKLPGGAMGSSFEQAQKGGFLDRMTEILLNELPRVQRELGNIWSVTPGSQILWTTAVSHTLSGVRYQNASDDLKNLLLERYGPFPFYRPDDSIYRAAFGPKWRQVIKQESGAEKVDLIDLEQERMTLERKIERKATTEELILYLQHPKDAVDFMKFEDEFGHTYVLPPEVWLCENGFKVNDAIDFTDHYGKVHRIIFGPSQQSDDGKITTWINIDHISYPFTAQKREPTGYDDSAHRKFLTREEMLALMEVGEVHSLTTGTVTDMTVKPGDHVQEGQTLIVLEAMKMLTRIVSRVNGEVSQVKIKASDKVNEGDLLLLINVENTQ